MYVEDMLKCLRDPVRVELFCLDWCGQAQPTTDRRIGPHSGMDVFVFEPLQRGRRLFVDVHPPSLLPGRP